MISSSDSISWDQLSSLSTFKERLVAEIVERWLWTLDIEAELRSSACNVDLMSGGLFTLLNEFVESRSITARALELLKDLLELAPPAAALAVNAARLGMLETSMVRWSTVDVLSGGLHVLSILATSQKLCDVKLLSDERLVMLVSQMMDDNAHSKKLQLRGATYMYNIIQSAAEGHATLSDAVVGAAVDRMCFILRYFNDEDVILICCQTLVVVSRTFSHLLAPLLDDLVPLVSTLFAANCMAAVDDVAALCLVILEPLVGAGEHHVLTLFADTDALHRVADAAVTMTRGNAAFAAFNLLRVVLPSLSAIVKSEADTKLLYSKLTEGVGKDTAAFVRKFEMPDSLRSTLTTLVDDVLQEMRSLLGVEAEAHPSDGAVDDNTDHAEADAGDDDNGALSGDNDVVGADDDANLVPDDDGDGIDEGAADDDEGGWDVAQADQSDVGQDDVNASAEHANIIQVAAVSQQQAAVTMVRAEIMHRLFMDATQKIEHLILREKELQAQVATLQEQQGQDGGDAAGSSFAQDPPHHHFGSAPQTDGFEGGNDAHPSSETEWAADDQGYEVKGLRAFDVVDMQPSAPAGNEDLNRHVHSKPRQYPSGAAADRLWLAVAGTIEALTIITLTAETGSKYGFESTFELKGMKQCRRTLLQHGVKTVLKPSQWVKYDRIHMQDGGACYAVGSETVSADKMDALAELAVGVFLHVKDGGARLNGGATRSKQSVLSHTLFRTVLKNMNVFLMRDVDIVFSRLAVPSVSIYGFCFAMMLCMQKLEKKWSSAEDLVEKLSSILAAAAADPTKYLLPAQSPPSKHSRQSENRTSPSSPAALLEIESQLAAGDMARLLEKVGRENAALLAIFQAYSTAGAGVAPAMDFGNNGSWGVSFEGVTKFAHDFDLYPNVVTHSQLFKIFGDAFDDPVLDVRHVGTMGSALDDGSPMPHGAVTARRHSNHHGGRSSGSGEPLLHFRQFECLIVLVALRSSYFRDAVEAKTNLDRLLTAASPQRGRLVHAMRPDAAASSVSPATRRSESAVFTLAVERINRLIVWLNNSRGKDKLSARARSIASTRLILRMKF